METVEPSLLCFVEPSDVQAICQLGKHAAVEDLQFPLDVQGGMVPEPLQDFEVCRRTAQSTCKFMVYVAIRCESGAKILNGLVFLDKLSA